MSQVRKEGHQFDNLLDSAFALSLPTMLRSWVMALAPLVQWLA
jgi:hypothetical protein